jgi:hypothetical protein
MKTIRRIELVLDRSPLDEFLEKILENQRAVATARISFTIEAENIIKTAIGETV